MFPKDVEISPSSKMPTLPEPEITGTNGLTSVSVPREARGQFLNQRHLRYTAVLLAGETSTGLRSGQVTRHLLSQRETSESYKKTRITRKLRGFSKWATGAVNLGIKVFGVLRLPVWHILLL